MCLRIIDQKNNSLTEQSNNFANKRIHNLKKNKNGIKSINCSFLLIIHFCKIISKLKLPMYRRNKCLTTYFAEKARFNDCYFFVMGITYGHFVMGRSMLLPFTRNIDISIQLHYGNSQSAIFEHDRNLNFQLFGSLRSVCTKQSPI